MKYLQLHAHVQFVKGSELGALYDLQRGKVHTAPLIMEQVLEAYANMPLTEVLNQCFGGNKEIFDRYTQFLLGGGWAFITAHPQRFPVASLALGSPYRIHSAIVAHDFLRPYDISQALGELSDVGSRHLELQLYHYPTVGKTADTAWAAVGEALRAGEFRRCTLVISPTMDASPIALETIAGYLQDWPRIGTVVMLGQRDDRSLEQYGQQYHLRRALTIGEYARKTWELHPDTNFVGPNYFREAKVANPYFNRRLAIDPAGNFKNDLLYGGKDTFGKVGERPIREVIADPNFQRRWQAGPDAIAQTKSNPLRYCIRYDRPIEADPSNPAAWSFASA